MSADPSQALLELSHQLGGERLRMAILGEGNTSARLDDRTFLVKASGCNLATLARADLTRCAFDRLLPLMDRTSAMRTRDPALVLQFGQVAAGGGLGDVELLADLQDGDVADLGEKLGDGLATGLDDMTGDFHRCKDEL